MTYNIQSNYKKIIYNDCEIILLLKCNLVFNLKLWFWQQIETKSFSWKRKLWFPSMLLWRDIWNQNYRLVSGNVVGTWQLLLCCKSCVNELWMILKLLFNYFLNTIHDNMYLVIKKAVPIHQSLHYMLCFCVVFVWKV